MQFCPQCHLILESATWRDVALFACRNCGGTWLSASDFATFYPQKWSAFLELNTLYPGILDSSSAAAYAGLPKTCPVCRTAQMEPAPLSQAPDVSPATCTQCGGVWLEPEQRKQLAGEESIPPSAVDVPVPTSTVPPNLLQADQTVEQVEEPSKPEQPEPEVLRIPPRPTWQKAETPAITAAIEPTFALPVEPLRPVEPEPPTEEQEVEEVLAELSATRQDACCPVCLTVYSREQEVCPNCACKLVDPDFRVWCPQCRVENSFAAERCRGCRKPLRTPSMLAQLYLSEQYEASAENAGLAAARTVIAPPPSQSWQPDARWCPQCRRGYPESATLCTDCGERLVAGNYRIRCLRCENANTIAATNCWSCQAPLHPDGNSPRPIPQPPALASANAMTTPRPSRSCATLFAFLLVLIVPVVCVAAAILVIVAVMTGHI